MQASTDAVRIMRSVEELLAELDERRPFLTSDSLSGNRFESVRFHGDAMILKYICIDDDWIMRATGDINCALLRLVESGVMSRVPPSIDHATVAVAPFTSRRGHRGAALLMREVGSLLIPPGSDVIELETHGRFIEHMAQMHATFWAFEDTFDLFPVAHHYVFLTPLMAELELASGAPHAVPLAVAEGWSALRRMVPNMARTLDALARDPSPLVEALGRTPSTLVHGDWKLGNLGEHGDGRTVLLDWTRSGAGTATLDLGWYLAVNCDRLPESKEAAIERYRRALQRCNVEMESWWNTQLSLALLGAALQLAWAKVHDPKELHWWEERVSAAEHLLA
jgi:hypothetical protein